jgi:enoyl-CoA hydratase
MLVNVARTRAAILRPNSLAAVYRAYSSEAPSYSNILVSRTGKSDAVSLITLNRPKALNALNSELFHELNDALERIDGDKSVGAVVLTGSPKAFAAGADIKEMKDKTASEAYSTNFLGHWAKMNSIKTPTIAAVSGYALGGGCELAMMYRPSLSFSHPKELLKLM